MQFLWPGFLALLLIVPAMIGIYVWTLRRRRPSGVRYSSLSLVRTAQPGSSRLRRHLPFALFVVGLASLAVPADELDAVALALARRVAQLPANQLHMMKLLVNQAYEQMGLRVTQLIGTLLDGAARHTPEGLAFSRAALQDVRRAVAERDAPFGDYGQEPRD